MHHDAIHKFLTVHIVNTLPLHNMNRDQSGLPKSQFDGGIQRGRLSSQALKRAARVAFLRAKPEASVRTRDGVGVAMTYAAAHAQVTGLPFDEKAGRAAIKKVIDGLAKNTKENAKKESEKESSDRLFTKEDVDQESKDESADQQGDNILFFATTELQALAVASVEKQHSGTDLDRGDCIQDARSPSLDVAAFGRMFAAAQDIGTQPAIAVSHAATTHPFQLTADYFSAVDDAQIEHAGAAHIGMTYYTSGTYYRSFTIDTYQLARSWSRVNAEGSREEFTALLRALIVALPSGRVANSNPHTLPALILAEAQRSRCAYDFDEPIQADGKGYKAPTIAALAEKRRDALVFDPHNFGTAFVVGQPDDVDFVAEQLRSIDDLVDRVVDVVFRQVPAAAGGVRA